MPVPQSESFVFMIASFPVESIYSLRIIAFIQVVDSISNIEELRFSQQARKTIIFTQVQLVELSFFYLTIGVEYDRQLMNENNGNYWYILKKHEIILILIMVFVFIYQLNHIIDCSF